MKIARMPVTPQLLKALLHLPESTRIVDAWYMQDTNEIILTVEDESFDDVAEGQQPPRKIALFQRQEPFVFTKWETR